MPDPAGADDEAMVLAMPRRELFRVSGFTPRVELEILESLVDDSWYVAPRSLDGNLEAKEVRLGLVITRGERHEEILVGDGGLVLHTLSIPPGVGQLGPGVRALRELVLVTCRELIGGDAARVELIGCCNEDALPETRRVFLLVYRCRVSPEAKPPPTMAWTPAAALATLAVDPVSALILPALAR
jgi:hypothetical protein